jgi:hypothetical protein
MRTKSVYLCFVLLFGVACAGWAEQEDSDTAVIKNPALDSAFYQLNEKNIQFDPPERMRVGEDAVLSAYVSRFLQDSLQVLLQNADYTTDHIRLSPTKSAHLYGAGFEILPKFHPYEDPYRYDPEGEYREWSWKIKPIQAGHKTLNLQVQIWLVDDHDSLPYNLPVMTRTVEVNANPLFGVGRLLTEYWVWLAALLLVPLLVWIYGYQNRKKHMARSE